MPTAGDDDAATEILNRDIDAHDDAHPAAAATQIQHDTDTSTDTLSIPRPTCVTPRHPGRWAAAAALAMAIAGALVYYFIDRSPETTDAVRARHDAYAAARKLAARALDRGDTSALPAQLLARARAQPDDPELARLLRDATRYRDMLYLQANGHLLELAQARRRRAFESSLFETSARRHIDAALPPAALLQRLSQARDAWRSGELVAAISALKRLTDETGNSQAEAMLRHYARLVQGYEALSERGTGGRDAQALVAFYLDLDPAQDQFFWRRMERDLSAADAAAAAALRRVQRAGQLWADYRRRGGIDGSMRQAATAHAGFAERAASLVEADTLLRAAAALLHPRGNAAAHNLLLPALVREELQMQRERLVLLQRFNNEAVFARRLRLLQDPARAGQH